MTEQLSIDFDRPPDPWAENAAKEAARWTPEMLMLVWITGRSFDVEQELPWWNSLHEYERNDWRMRYECERERADRMGVRMWSADSILALENEHYERNRKLAESWAEDLRQAFLKGQPCPIKPVPAYEWILRWAFELASVNPASLKENAAPPHPSAISDQLSEASNASDE